MIDKQTIINNLSIEIDKPKESLGGQQCGMPIYPMIVKSEDLNIEIKVGHYRSNHQNRELAITLIKLAIDELVK